MPNATFLAGYSTRRLNQIVLPGAHDAGVYTQNAANVQTQDLDIYDQAVKGCRFFDMRIATAKRSDGTLEQRAFHLDPSLVRNHTTFQKTSHQNVSHLGGWGGGLNQMLDDAKRFVTHGHTNSEFLILKFSKCYNWENVAQACIDRLGDAHYKVGGDVNLNMKTCGELAGKVITVFDEEARKVLGKWKLQKGASANGIKFSRALFDKKTKGSKPYESQYDGIQYFGKFSSTDDIVANQKKQQKTLVGGAQTSPNAMGMMYWTTTAMKQDIRARNETMWTPIETARLKATWKAGLEASIKARFGANINHVDTMLKQGHGSFATMFMSFMPNIVMMDFVNYARCSTIIGLNEISPNDLQLAMAQSAGAPKSFWQRVRGK